MYHHRTDGSWNLLVHETFCVFDEFFCILGAFSRDNEAMICMYIHSFQKVINSTESSLVYIDIAQFDFFTESNCEEIGFYHVALEPPTYELPMIQVNPDELNLPIKREGRERISLSSTQHILAASNSFLQYSTASLPPALTCL